MRLSFDFVAIEQGVIGTAAQHVRQLPCEIGSISNTRAEALPKEWRRLVHGVPHKEHAMVSPAFSEQCVEAIDRRAPDRQIGCIAETSEQFDNIVWRAGEFRVFARQ